MVAIHGNTEKKKHKMSTLKSTEGAVILMLFIYEYSIVHKYFYMTIFLNAYFTFYQPKEMKTNRCMDNTEILR